MKSNIDIPALCQISYGLYIISTCQEEKFNGQIVNVVSQVTAEPRRIITAISKKNLTHEMISCSRVFGVSVLEQDTPMTFIGNFGFKSGRDINKFAGVSFEKGVSGTPLVTDFSIAIIEAQVIDTLDCGSHTVFMGDVISARYLKDAVPMSYAWYHQVKKGKSPVNAPSFALQQENKKEQRSSEMKKFVCNVCGYVYDPAVGDPDSGIAPGTPFDSIPDTWVCPVCGVGKSEFSPE